VRPFTFVHTADCHLDTPFAGVGREDPSLAKRLREAQRAVFDGLIDLCIDRQAAFLLVVGMLIWAWRIYPRGHRVRSAAIFSMVFMITEALVGAGLLSAASVASKLIMPGAVFPIGIVTSFIGIPFFLFLILSKRRSYW